MSLKLKRWDPSVVQGDKTILVIGKRGSGKSVAVADLMYNQRKCIPAAVVFSGTEESNGYFGQYIPKEYLYSEYDTNTVNKIVERQKSLIKQKRPSPTMLILDDVAYDKGFFKDKLFRYIMLNGRHVKLFTIVTQQYSLDTPPYARSNFDYVICFRDPILSNRERLYKQFFGIFPNFNAFQDVFAACTENFECLVIDQTARSNKIEDCVFWWKAKLRPPFRFGSDAYWSAAKAIKAKPKPKPSTDEANKKKPPLKKRPTVQVKKIL